jgi:hypothetical protein
LLYGRETVLVSVLCERCFSYHYLLRVQRSGGSRFKVSLTKQFERPCPEKPITKKRAGGVAQGAGPEFKPQYCKKNFKCSTSKEKK